jgi:hypothetical protein
MINPFWWPLFYTIKMFPVSGAIKSTSESKIFFINLHKSYDKSLHGMYQIIKETTNTFDQFY